MEYQMSERRKILLAGLLKICFYVDKLTVFFRTMQFVHCSTALHGVQQSWGLTLVAAWYGMSHAGGYSWSEVVVYILWSECPW